MEINWTLLLWAGFIATTISATFFWIFRSLDLTRFSPTTQLGCIFFQQPGNPASEVVGFLLLYLLGSLAIPALYLLLLGGMGTLSWWLGAVLGAIHGLLSALLLPFFGTISACVRGGRMPPPGHLGLGWGKATPLGLVLGHAVYGGILIAILDAF